MEIKVRDVDAAVVAKIDELARKKGISRSKYIRSELEKIALAEDVVAVEDKYTNLINVLVDRIQQAGEAIDINTAVIERCMKMIEENTGE